MTTKLKDDEVDEKVLMYMNYLRTKDTGLRDSMLDLIQEVYKAGVIAGSIFECSLWEKELKEKGSVESEVSKMLRDI